MTAKKHWIHIATLALVLSTSAEAQERPREPDTERHAAARPSDVRRWVLRQRIVRAQTRREGAERRPGARSELRRFLEELDVTDAQRRAALAAAKEASPIAREARREAARIRLRAREGREDGPDPREAMRERTRELRQRTLAKLRPLAERVLATLTPEQREKLGGQREKLGDLDEKRLTNIVSWLLTRPRTTAAAGARIRR